MNNSTIKYQSIALLILSVFILSACTEKEVLPEEGAEEVEVMEEDPYNSRYGEKIDYQPFGVDFKLDSNYLVVDLNISEGSFILSEDAGDEFKGRYEISFEENSGIVKVCEGVADSAPIEEVYYWADNEKVKKHVGKVTSRQELRFDLEEDFEIKGKLGFTVEPNCNYYETTFLISQKSGQREVTKIGTEKNPEEAMKRFE